MTQVLASTVLKEAKRLIEEVGWCQEAFAKDERGQVIDNDCLPALPAACVFCSLGALNEAGHRAKRSMASQLTYSFFRQAIDGQDIADWNDNPDRTKLEVIEAFDKAIKFALEREKGTQL